MNLEEIKDLLIGKEVMIESRWEFIEIDSVGRIKEISKLNRLFIFIMDNKTKIVCKVDQVERQDDGTINFINITPDRNEIIVFRIKLI